MIDNKYRENAAVEVRKSNATALQYLYMALWAASTVLFVVGASLAGWLQLGWIAAWIIYVFANDGDPSRPRKGLGWGLLGLVGLFSAQVLIVVLAASTQTAYLIGGGGQ